MWRLGFARQQTLSTRLVQLTELLARKEITYIRTGDTGTRSAREGSFYDRQEAVEDKSDVGSPRHGARCAIFRTRSFGREHFTWIAMNVR